MKHKGFLFLMLMIIVLRLNHKLFANGPTEGVIQNTEFANKGYTLFAPMGFRTTYLIDNYGRIVKTWKSSFYPSFSVYLLENGNIVRSFYNEADLSETKYGVQMYSWDGELIWDFVYTDTFYLSHHDIEPLPNGNILMVVRDIRLRADLEDAGRDPASISTARIWSEKIVEIEPTGLNTGNIVWEWEIYDHLVQDFDITKDNYGVVEDHPELMDVNYTPSELREWLHANAIDYNSDFDQIVLNLRNIHEFWVIDHSTTTAEAATHTGGNSGKGGDILYRWGNPQTYRAQSNDDQKYFEQHDARWVENGYPGEGNITVFNNGITRPEGLYSTADEIIVPVDANGNYTPPVDDSSYEPTNPAWSYIAEIPESMYSSNISGATRLKNGNTLICEGSSSHFYEVKPDNTIAWEYKYPSTRSIFRCHRYELDYSAFDGRDLVPKGYIEINPITIESTQHFPEKPTDLDEVVITSKIYDDLGISSVVLNTYYDVNHLAISMLDDGNGYDQAAGDSIYTASVPALPGYTLVNYYIEIKDGSADTFYDTPLNTFYDPPFATQDYTFSYYLISTKPVNIVITKTVGSTLIEWDAIEGVSNYKVYSSSDPYNGFEEDLSGILNGESWSTAITETKKFYYIKAVK